ncbi:P-loop containing nucleoside triphosphate hydrolase protein [Protomyces lactucae-debilis]|uniref:Replication factor C subunit 2 n=1 Tax=Protomyces lactucae-debilis TaxID=2754530 RepID=A0A1Y2F8U8_PROLT|nr:P-loop containing nucleoside triphosphate hydrolase protein [Protomyces lactucae-debilis]ORY80309.1 P-loop containing nucleoside triphosphate hydrolase protein [Protomyces lactucae-debilis]
MLGAKKVAKAPQENTQIWVEKYRPKTLDQVSSQEHTVAVLKKTLLHANMAHMLFYGPPGTGKTSTILALAKELYGPEMFKSRVLELNASDERGIAIVREKVKNFAKTAVTADQTQGGYPCPPYKIIILDEADSMTQDAQSALRRTMEQYSKITRFCLICNYVTRIIEPLASRCSKFRFKPLDASDTVSRLKYIAEQEKVTYEDGVLEALNKTCEGDLRKAITYMQSAAKLHRSLLSTTIDLDGDTTLNLDAKITLDSIAEIAGTVPEGVVQSLLRACKEKQAFGALNKLTKEAVAEGYNAIQIMSQLHDLVVEDEHITNQQKNAILMYLSLTDKRLNDGADEHLQILDMLTTMRSIMR